jgi:hypothetical protein
MKIAFTLCSLNYMHQAITLRESLLKHNPDYKFIIGLVDKINDKVDKKLIESFEMIEVDTVMSAPILKDMTKRYNIIELNTAVKPYYFEYLFNHYNPEHVTYFDPDIMIFNRLSTIEKIYEEGNNLIVTPHATTPKEKGPQTDIAFIKAGIFNFGFVSMRNTETCVNLVKWWQRRLFESCYLNTPVGLCVDQLWMNLSVCYTDKSYILRDVGHNMAPWNLHERTLSKREGIVYVNEKTPLTFFHFSHITDKNNFLKGHDTSLTFDQRPDLKDVFGLYNKQIAINGKDVFKPIPCEYTQGKFYFRIYLKKLVMKFANKFIDLHEKL